jgi:hypothetical protein
MSSIVKGTKDSFFKSIQNAQTVIIQTGMKVDAASSNALAELNLGAFRAAVRTVEALLEKVGDRNIQDATDKDYKEMETRLYAALGLAEGIEANVTASDKLTPIITQVTSIFNSVQNGLMELRQVTPLLISLWGDLTPLLSTGLSQTNKDRIAGVLNLFMILGFESTAAYSPSASRTPPAPNAAAPVPPAEQTAIAQRRAALVAEQDEEYRAMVHEQNEKEAIERESGQLKALARDFDVLTSSFTGNPIHDFEKALPLYKAAAQLSQSARTTVKPGVLGIVQQLEAVIDNIIARNEGFKGLESSLEAADHNPAAVQAAYMALSSESKRVLLSAVGGVISQTLPSRTLSLTLLGQPFLTWTNKSSQLAEALRQVTGNSVEMRQCFEDVRVVPEPVAGQPQALPAPAPVVVRAQPPQQQAAPAPAVAQPLQAASNFVMDDDPELAWALEMSLEQEGKRD